LIPKELNRGDKVEDEEDFDEDEDDVLDDMFKAK